MSIRLSNHRNPRERLVWFKRMAWFNLVIIVILFWKLDWLIAFAMSFYIAKSVWIEYRLLRFEANAWEQGEHLDG